MRFGDSVRVDYTSLQGNEQVITMDDGTGDKTLMKHKEGQPCTCMKEGALDAGGHVTGIIQTFLDRREVSNHAVHELRVVADMHERKKLMFDLSQVFVVLPGGLGTLEEMFEVLTWKQLDQHNKAIVLANFDNYWDPALELMRHMGDEGYLHSQSEQLLFEIKSPEELAALLGK